MWFIFPLSCYCYVMTQKVLRGEAVPSRAKTQQRIGRKCFYSDTSYGLEYVKTGSVNYLLRCS